MGTAAELARALGVSAAAVSHWRTRGQVSHTRVLEIEALTGVKRERLRPDLYG